ncbi:MAG: DegT/DnrJ/EryC1/StrS family aminotransferase [Verrucomicrobiota bacterium]
MNRRRFLGTAAVTGTALSFGLTETGAGPETAPGRNGLPKPALLGGAPVRSDAFPSWPVIDEAEDKAVLEVLHSRHWTRSYGGLVAGRLEEAYAKLTGAKHCVAVANGTSALFASLGALGVGPGDEVILPPYTFVATLNVILLQYALPIFVDVELDTFQIDPSKIEPALTDRTAAVIPVHLGGNVANMDGVLGATAQRKIPVVEDACQSHLAEWRGRKVGTLGTTGCFSFQASKNLNCGEGGAILTNDAEVAEKCYAFQNNCRPRTSAGYNFNYLGSRGANLRLTDFQAAVLLAQMQRVEKQSQIREQNAQYLTGMLKEIPGIVPARMHEGCTRNAYHLYMLRYEPEYFGGMSRAKFLKALNAEGIPSSAGYSPLNKESFVKATLKTKGYQKIYPPEVLANWEDRTQCPTNEKLCEQAVWFTQNMFVGSRQDMDQIADAIRKIHGHAGELARA